MVNILSAGGTNGILAMKTSELPGLIFMVFAESLLVDIRKIAFFHIPELFFLP
jgi:hypothetical protein